MTKQVVLLAAGKSSRFYPFNDTHKSMFTVCGKPIIGWTLDALKKLGVKDVVVVVSKEDKKIIDHLRNYQGFGINLIYQKEPLGMGNALLSAKKSLNEIFIVGFPHFVNGKIFETLFNQDQRPKILTDRTEESWKYGILTVEKGRATGIVEKPKKGEERSNIRASGCYLLNREFLKTLEKTEPSEYQFESALDSYMKEDEVLAVQADSLVIPFKYIWDIVAIKDYILGSMGNKISESSSVSPSAVVKGRVVIEEGAKVSDFALVEGPVYIGKNAVVGVHCILRNYSVLGEGAEIQRYVDCTRSIIGMNSHIHSGFVGDSIIGESVRIGAGFITANRRIDRGEVGVVVKDEKVSTRRSNMGVLVGDFVKIGINVSTMPGVIMGRKSMVGPNTVIMKNIPDETLVYAEQKLKVTHIKK